MLSDFLDFRFVPVPQKQTALLLAGVALFGALQAKNSDPVAPAVTLRAGPTSTVRSTEVAASAAPSNLSAANSDQRMILKNSVATLAPVITIQPVSQIVPAGYSATFTVLASGIPAPTYQWQKGGLPISGATASSYTIASAGLGDAGNYSVVVANSAGAATSEVAELKTVVAPPSHGVVAIAIQ